MATTGTISQVIGSTFDAEFPEDQLPSIYNAVTVNAETRGVTVNLTGEVQQHLGGGRVRAIALGTTDGLARGMTKNGYRRLVSVHSSALKTLGARVTTCCSGSRSIKKGPVNAKATRSIHQPPPEFKNLEPKTKIFETGIKVIDLLAPYVRGGKTGLFGGAGVGKTVIIQELIARLLRSSTRVTPFRRGRQSSITREGNDLWLEMSEAEIGKTGKHVIDQTVMVFGQMNEPPGSRLRVALSALTMAEYFRDQSGADVLLFIDNIFRFTQAGSGSVASHLGPYAVCGRLPAHARHGDGRTAGTHHLHQ